MPRFFMYLLKSTGVVIFWSGSGWFYIVIFIFHKLADKIYPCKVFFESPGVKNILNYKNFYCRVDVGTIFFFNLEKTKHRSIFGVKL